VWLGNKVDLGRRVAVIGGGNVAADVARTARRLGAEYVAMICLESWEEMPAEPQEIELAQGEGIQILPRQAPKRVLNRDGKIAAIELMSVVSVFDEAGRFRPTYDPSRIRTLNVDMVILSIGQAPDRSWARGSSIRTDARGRIVVDRDTHVTSHPRVFLAGESLRGPGAAIEAVADGHRVAEVVAGFLATGGVATPSSELVAPLDPFPEEVLARLRRMSAADTEPEPFAQEEPLLDETAARREAGRCLGCLAGAVIDETKCASCLTCFRVCPLSAVEIGEAMVANPVRCQACGVCAAVCPGSAISLTFWEGEAERAAPAAEPAAERAAPDLAVVCRHRSGEETDCNKILTVPCLARMKPVDVLRLFRLGHRTVSLYPCARDECKYGAAWENIESLASYVSSVLGLARPEARLEVCLPREEAEEVGAPAGETP
jgi:ferredoxin